MADIKVREVAEKSIKTLDRAKNLGDKASDTTIHIKNKTEKSVNTSESTLEEYVSERMEGVTDSTAHEAIHQFNKQGGKSVNTTKDNISKAKEFLKKKQAKDVPVKKSAKTVKRSTRSVTKSAKLTSKATTKTAKGTIKTAQKSIKTAEKTGKVAIKTVEKTAKATKATAYAVRVAVKTPIATAKIAIKAILVAIKAIIAAVKALVAAIAAGGWVAVVIIVVICLVALIVGSCFGLFFSNENTGSSYSMWSVITEISNEYLEQIESLKSRYTYDVLEMSGATVDWEEVLSVYSVKTTTDSNDATEVASIDDDKKALIREIFWMMNTLTAQTETKTETVVTQTVDGHGNIVDTTTTVTKVYLYITVTHKSTDEMANHYSFNEEQRAQLSELLSNKNRSMWDGVLAGMT